MNNFLQKTIFLILLFASSYASAQTSGSATGKIINSKDKTPIDYASVAVKKLSDSSVVGGTNTNPTGTFTINNLPAGKYKLYIGLKTVTKEFELTAAKPSINFGSIAMENTGVDLKTVEVKGEIPPVVVKKDTLEFSAANIKVKENAVVEDLVKKLPGVDVAKDGTITTQGETIKKVRVDGKDFMGNDPLLATRNLPADMVDKIQIIDDMSEQSKFSGVDDGNREKILNIVTKNGVKNKGFVGNSSVGYGTDDRYDANINVNYFDKSQQISLIGQFNNVNKQNFGGGIGGGGGGRGMQFSGGGGASTGGITTTNAAGINFGDTYDDGTQFNGSYFFNKTSMLNTNNSFTQSLLGTTINNLSDLNSTTERLNHRLNFTVDTKLDSSTSIRVQPSVSYSENTGLSLYNYNRTVGAVNTVGTQSLQTNSESPSISNSLLIRHRFQRRGRTLSLNINTNINDSDADNFNNNPYIVKVGTVTTNFLTNQFNDNNTNSLSNTSRLVFTEPLSKTLSLELNYQNGYSFDNKERFAYTFNNATQSYDIKDPKNSNEYENTTWTNSVGLSLQKNEKKYNWNIGLAGQYTTRNNQNITTGIGLHQDFINLTPSAQFRYNFTNSKRLTIRYNGRTNQPTIDQIQPIPDNTNTQVVPIGNPNLKPAFQNSLNVFYNNFNFATFRTFFIGGFFNQYFNAIANDQRVRADGVIENGYTNVDGNFSASVFSNMGQPIIKGNKLTLQVNLNANYDKSTNLGPDRNNVTIENVTKSLTFGNGYKLVSNLDKLDLIAGISGSWTHANYTQSATVNSYTLAPNIDISYLFPGNIRLQTDVTYNQTTGRGEAYNTSFTLVNAYMSRQFFKNKGTFKLSVNDLFNENTGISRTVNNNQISDINFNVLKRYYMLSFTYSLGNVGGRSMNNMPGQGGGGQRMRMGGM
jgi:hypothetical protein